MRHLVLPVALISALSLPISAQEAGEDDGLSLMEEGARLFFRGIIEEMEPAMDDLLGLAEEMQPALRDFVKEMGPALADLVDKVDDWTAYHPPEILPNGDIILRRKTPEEQLDEPQGEVDI